MAVRVKDRIEANIRQSDKVNNSLSIQLNSGTTTVYDGSTGRSINITPAAIDASATSHTHGLLTHSLSKRIANTTENSGWSMIVDGYSQTGFMLHSLRTQGSAPEWILGDYSSGIAYGGDDTKGVISSACSSPKIRFAGGNGTAPKWWIELQGATGTIYNLNTGSNVMAAKADIWTTARTFTIGNKAMSVNGSVNIEWPLYDILRAGIINTAAASWDITIPGVYGVACSETYTGSGNPEGGAFALYRWGSLTVINSAQGIAQIYIPHTASGTAASGIRYRSGYGTSWNTAWDIILDSTNYTYYTVTKTGAGASGTWGISISGNAATATTATEANQLTTARTIALGGQFSGSTSFNGTGNVTISGELKKASINGNNTNTYPYRRFAYAAPGTGQHNDHYGVFLITKNCENNLFGIIKVSHRTNGFGSTTSCSATWLIRSGISEDAVTIASWGTSGTDNVYFDVYYKADDTWPRTTITALGPCNMTLCDSSEATNAASTTYAYASVAAGGTALHNQAYTTIKTSTQTPIYGAVWN